MNGKRLILFVDDEPDILEVVAFRLRKAGYDVIIAGDGEEVLEKAASLQPDLILLDVVLPGMNGYEVCRKLKSDPQMEDTPVLFFTAAVIDTDTLTEKVKKAGGQGYVIKPFLPDELVKTIERHMRKKKEEG